MAGALALLAVQQGFGIKGAAVCASFGGVHNAVLLLSTAPRPFRILRPRLEGQLTIATAAIPFLILAASNVLYARIDAFMVNGYRGANDLGLYSAAVRCLDVLQLVPNALAAAMLPRAFRKVARGDSLHEWLGRILEASSVIATPCVVAVAIAAQWIVKLLFGAAYSRSGEVLALLSLTVLVSILNSPLTLYFYVEDRARHLIHVPVVMLIFNLAANAIALPTAGIRGAAAATVATELVGTAVLVLALRRHKLGVPLRRLVSAPLTMLCMGIVVIGGARSWPLVSALVFSLVWTSYVALRPSIRTMLFVAFSKLREV
jgi:O-antigen/teichoic acid export membrane protein